MELETKKKIDLMVGGLGIFFLKPVAQILGRLLRREHRLSIEGDVLVLKLLGGGSLLLAFPALLSLRKNLLPGQKLILVTTKQIAPFAEVMAIFDHIYFLDDHSILRMGKSFFYILWKVLGKIDTCFDLEVHSRGTSILSLMSGARNRLGFYKESSYWRLGIYTHLVFYNTYSLSSSFYDALISLVKVKLLSFEQAVQAFKEKHIDLKTENIITVGFSCSDNATERMLSVRQWADALKNLKVDQVSKIYLLGTAKDFSLAEEIKEKVESLTGVSCINSCGKMNLKEAVACIGRSMQFWGIDSSLLHFARLLGIEAVSFWGPTDPHTRLSPRAVKDHIFYQKIACSPCVHFADIPPCKGNNRCIEALFEKRILDYQVTWAIMPDSRWPLAVEK